MTMLVSLSTNYFGSTPESITTKRFSKTSDLNARVRCTHYESRQSLLTSFTESSKNPYDVARIPSTLHTSFAHVLGETFGAGYAKTLMPTRHERHDCSRTKTHNTRNTMKLP